MVKQTSPSTQLQVHSSSESSKSGTSTRTSSRIQSKQFEKPSNTSVPKTRTTISKKSPKSENVSLSKQSPTDTTKLPTSPTTNAQPSDLIAPTAAVKTNKQSTRNPYKPTPNTRSNTRKNKIARQNSFGILDPADGSSVHSNASRSVSKSQNDIFSPSHEDEPFSFTPNFGS